MHSLSSLSRTQHPPHCSPPAPQPVWVEEPQPAQAIEWLRGLQPRYEHHHGVRYTPDAIDAAVGLAARYITHRKLPDSALDLLDEAAAAARLLSSFQGQMGFQGHNGQPNAQPNGQLGSEKQRVAAETPGATQGVTQQQQAGGGPMHDDHLEPSPGPKVDELDDQIPGAMPAWATHGWPSLSLGGNKQSQANAPVPRPCPHCGFPVPPGQHGASHIRCPRCATMFLNVAPEKLLLGTTVVVGRTAHASGHIRMHSGGHGNSGGNSVAGGVHRGGGGGALPAAGLVQPPLAHKAKKQKSTKDHEMQPKTAEHVPVVTVDRVVQTAAAATGIAAEAMLGSVLGSLQGGEYMAGSGQTHGAMTRLVDAMRETIVGQEHALWYGALVCGLGIQYVL